MVETQSPETKTVDFVGLMGVGKSTASKLVSEQLQLPIVPENFQDNPFLPKFFNKPKKFAFYSQLFFLNSKIAELQKFAKENQGLGIVDTSVFQDVFSYAQAQRENGSMTQEKWQLYLSVFSLYEGLIPPVAGIVFLTSKMKTVRNRIKGRGRSYEQDIPDEYLKLLDELNHQLVDRSASPVLRIDTTNLNLVDSENDQEAFIGEVRAFVEKIRPAI